jgi:hypothetical protein
MGDFTRYKFDQPCRICGHLRSGCMYKWDASDPETVLCRRVQEGCAVDGRGNPITAKDGHGWFHDLKKNPRRPKRPHAPQKKLVVNPFIAELSAEFEANLQPHDLTMLGGMLGVSTESLARLHTGWVKQWLDKRTGELSSAKAWTFPMRDDSLRIIGIRLRNNAGQKWTVKGSCNGIFVPDKLTGEGPLIIVEGPTETATVLDWNFDVIGRPGNTSGCDLVVNYCRRRQPRNIVILQNNDPKGSDAERLTHIGSNKLQLHLLATRSAHSVRIIQPPNHKDARLWKHAGATRNDLEALILSAIPKFPMLRSTARASGARSQPLITNAPMRRR